MELDEGVLRTLTQYAATWTGFSPEAIHPDAIRRTARRQLAACTGVNELLERASRGDRDLVFAFSQGVSVGETFFFRQPEHFQFVTERVLPLLLSPEEPIRAWSAGCATGEEGYSIAACLQGSVPPGVRVEVLGTDLVEGNIQSARRGLYRPWSVRDSGPLLYPLLEPADAERVRIREEVKRLVRFERHNLLDPPPGAPGSFDLIFCRNVLVYFSPSSIQRVCAHLSQALSRRGVLLFGTMDINAPLPGLVRYGSSALQAFVHPDSPLLRRIEPPPAAPAPSRPTPAAVRPTPPAMARPPPPKSPEPPRPPTATMPPPTEPVALHVRALVHIERGEEASAKRILSYLARNAPDYIPGIVESALLHDRTGDPEFASSLMREVLRRASGLPPDRVLAGPEPLPVEFYVATAEALLQRKEEGR